MKIAPVAMVALSVLVGSCAEALAQPSGVTVEARTGAPAYALGSGIDLHVRMLLSSGGEVVIPPAVQQLGPFEVLEIRPGEPVRQSGGISRSWVLRLITFETGNLTIPPLEFRVLNGNATQTFQTPAVQVTSTKPAVDLSGDLRPAKPPIRRPPNSRDLAAAIVVLLVSGSALALLYLASRLSLKVKIRWQTPSRRLVARLRALERRLPATDEEIAGFYAELSTLIRTFVEESVGVPASRLSTTELTHALARHPSASPGLRELEQLLQVADRVKFGRFRPKGSSAHWAAVQQACHIVRGRFP